MYPNCDNPSPQDDHLLTTPPPTCPSCYAPFPQKIMDMVPSSHGTTVPIVNKSEWEIADIQEDDFLCLFDEGGGQKDDVKLPTYPADLAKSIKEAWNEGERTVMVTVQTAMGMEEIVDFKIVND